MMLTDWIFLSVSKTSSAVDFLPSGACNWELFVAVIDNESAVPMTMNNKDRIVEITMITMRIGRLDGGKRDGRTIRRDLL